MRACARHQGGFPAPVAAAFASLGAVTGLCSGPAIAEIAEGWEVYGQISLGLMITDNGSDSETYFAENKQPPARVGAFYRLTLGAGETLSFNIETGLGLTTLGDVTPDNDDLDVTLDRTVLRKFEIIYDTADRGRFSLGQGSMASGGASGVDLSGTTTAIGPAIGDLGGGTEFLLASQAGSGVSVSDAFDDLDGPRRFRLRYDTPAWNGLRVGVAYGQEVLREGNDLDYTDIGLSYAMETEALSLEAAASYEWIDSLEERLIGSASALHVPMGLNATVAAGANQIGEADYTYLKLGVIRDYFSMGRTAIAVELYEGNDFAFAGADSRAVGLGISQRIDALDLELVAALRRYTLSASTAAYEDIDVTMVGARWQF